MSRKVVLANSAWLVADKVVRMGVGLVVWVWLARHFGPEGFGLWNYVIAFTALFGAVSGLGLDGIVVRELVRTPERAAAILGTAAALRVSAGLLCGALACLGMALTRPGDTEALLLTAFNSLVFVLQNGRVTEFHFQAHARARQAVMALNAAFLGVTLLRLGLLAFEAPMTWFGATLAIEGAAAFLLLYVAYRADSDSHRRWRVDRETAKALLSQSWPLLLSGMAVMIYMRLDQIMLAAFAGDEAVGHFSAALRLAEVWYFIPMALMTAAFPTMISRRERGVAEYERFIQQLYDVTAWLGVSVAVATTWLAPWLIGRLYGPAFEPSIAILAVQIWAGVTVSMSFVHSKWLLAEGLQKYSLLYTVLGACLNVGLNFYLIPRHGAVGAAWATLITQVGLLPVQLLFPRARRNFVLMMKSIYAPYRLVMR